MEHRSGCPNAVFLTFLTGAFVLAGCAASSLGGPSSGGAGGDELDLGDAGAAPARGSFHVEPKVLVLDWDPVLASRGGLPVTRAIPHYHDPHAMATRFADDMATATGNQVQYRIVDWVDLDTFPVLEDGHRPTEAEWLACLADNTQCHQPDTADYGAIMRDQDLCGRVERGEIDEVWLFGAPWFGFYESRMAGDGAFALNSAPLPGACSRRFVIFGFSYEREVSEMLHDMGHRLEFTMARAFQDWSARHGGEPDPFTLFRQTDVTAPIAACGDTHDPPNSPPGIQYLYGEHTVVQSDCDTFRAWPDIGGSTRSISCDDWGCDEEGYLGWLFDHVPREDGTHEGYQRDWWRYVYAMDTYLVPGAGGPEGAGASTPPDPVPAPDAGVAAPAACAALDRGGCDARADCAWFTCASACAPRGTTADALCPPAQPCEGYDSVEACDAHAGTCAWYACANRCYPEGTDVPTVCAADPPCESEGTLEACDTRPGTCAWYACANRCYPQTVPVASVCGG